MSNALTAANNYYNNVRRAFPTANSDSALFSLRNALENYAVECPNLQYADLVARFGEPEDIAELVIADEVTAALPRATYFSPRRALFLLLMITLLAFLIILGITITRSMNAKEHYYVIDYTDAGEVDSTIATEATYMEITYETNESTYEDLLQRSKTCHTGTYFES